jgi:hypothetical protein
LGCKCHSEYKIKYRPEPYASYSQVLSCSSLLKVFYSFIIYKRTRQDRRIREELALTLTKNATKPDPFEIIQLQTTRKKDNWKTEETLARTAVTLETERIKLVQSLKFMIMMMIIYRLRATCQYLILIIQGHYFIGKLEVSTSCRL